MKIRILLIISIILSVWHLHAGDTVQYFGHKVWAKCAIVKLHAGSQLKSSSLPSLSPAMRSLLHSAGASKLTQMFPRSLTIPCANCVDLSTIYRFTFSADIDIQLLIYQLAQMPEVVYAQPEFVHELCYVPNDPKLSQQYFHTNIGSYAAWDSLRSDTTIVIGITDTGFDITHDDLANSIAYNYLDPINGIDDDNDGYIDNFRGWDFGDNDNNPSVGTNDHGTWVAGLAAASADNGIGGAGASFGAKFLPVKIATQGGSLTQTWASIVYAADHGCQIINCSWGGTYREPLGEDVVNYATFNRNALVVAAAGNNATQEEFYPASYRNALGVAGTVANDQKWSSTNSQSKSGSSWGYFVDITAPAASYYSTANKNTYAFMYGGTSLSSPIVAGAAALVKTAFPQLSAIALGEQLKAQSDKIDTIPFNFPYYDMLGTGRVNSAKASQNMDRPGIRYTSYSVREAADLRPGDTLMLSVDIANYLADASSADVSIEFNTKFIRTIAGNHTIKNFKNNDTVTGVVFSFVFSPELPLDFNAIAKLVYTSGEYRSYDYITIPTNPSAKRLSTNKLSLLIPANGRLGSTSLIAGADARSSILHYDAVLGEAGLFCAEASNKIARSFLGTQDFATLSETKPCRDSSADYCYESSYRADLQELDIRQRVLAWDDSSYFIIKYSVKNTSLLEKNELVIGNYWDWNIHSPWNNSAGYHSGTMLSYTYSTEPATLYAGTMLLLTDTNTVFVTDSRSGADGLPDIFQDNTSETVYQCSKTWHPALRRALLGSDVSVFQSASARYIDRGDSISHQIAVVFAEDLEQLLSQAALIRNAGKTASLSSRNDADQFRIFPTHTDGPVWVEGLSAGAPTQVCVYTPDGQRLTVPCATSGGTAVLSLESLPSGMYIIAVTIGQQISFYKIVRR